MARNRYTGLDDPSPEEREKWLKEMDDKARGLARRVDEYLKTAPPGTTWGQVCDTLGCTVGNLCDAQKYMQCEKR